MKLEIICVPAFNDNYLWLIIHPNRPEALVVDPGDAAPVLAALKARGLGLAGILITHKHNDHIGGVKELLAHYPVPVFGSKTENIPLITHFVSENEIISIPNWPNIHVIEVPGHTLGHVAYLVGNNLFCGDTLFGAGCGRLFEGTPAQMFESLSKINALPEDTLVYCAHEYTLKNLTFALKVDPTNEMIAKRISETETLLAQGKPSVPFTLKIEKETNPFLRCENPAIQQTIENHIGQQLNNDEVMVFKNMREWRNVW